MVQGVGDEEPAADKNEDDKETVANKGEDVEGEEVDDRVREPMKVHNPLLPSGAEIEQHMLTHLPFRSWCEHCV